MSRGVLIIVAASLTACGSRSNDDFVCGPGTVAVGRTCLPDDAGVDSDVDSDSATDSATDTGSEPDCSSGGWVSESVYVAKDEEHIPEEPVLAIAPDGAAHVLHDWLLPNELVHTWKEDGVWRRETLTGDHWGAHALVVDDEGTFFATFTTDTWEGFLATKPTSGALVVERIDVLDAIWLSLALDATGAVHVAFIFVDAVDGEHVGYATKASGDWDAEIVTYTNRSSRTGIALESNGTVHVVASSAMGFLHGTNESGAWVAEAVDSDDLVISGVPTIAIDSSDRVHVVYGGAPTRYATLDGVEWQIEDAAPGGRRTVPKPVVIDEAGHPHYCQAGESDSGEVTAQHVWRDDSNWHTEVIAEDIGFFWTHCSIALDPSGNLWVAYEDDSHRDPYTGAGPSIQLAHRCP